MSERTRCISHPAKSPLVMIRSEYIDICNGDHCAAALLAVFEFWHDNKLSNLEQAEIDAEIAKDEDMEPEQSDSLWVYKSNEHLHKDLLGLFGETKIASGVKYLLACGYISTRRNPRYKWDKKPQYLFNVSIVQDSISQNSNHRLRENTEISREKDSVKIRSQLRENTEAIAETSTPPALPTEKQEISRPSVGTAASVGMKHHISAEPSPAEAKTAKIQTQPNLAVKIAGVYGNAKIAKDKLPLITDQSKRYDEDPIYASWVNTVFLPTMTHKKETGTVVRKKIDDLLVMLIAEEGYAEYKRIQTANAAPTEFDESMFNPMEIFR